MLSQPAIRIIKSPLRYPGGKGVLSSYFSELMKKNGLAGGKYLEPFAGGAGLALGLLSSRAASVVLLNDADYHIYCFWTSVIKENERFLEEIRQIELSINEWQKQKAIYSSPGRHSVFAIGFSTFYLNRCNRSGILAGAGPIGGYEQKGKWQLDARFNKDNLSTRIADIGAMKDQIKIENMDAIDFLKKYLPSVDDRKKTLVYIDPPYVSAGDRLYLNLFSVEDHIKLADYLLEQADLKWVLTYDDHSLIKELYSSCRKWLFNIGYSLQSKQKGKELLIAPEWVLMPNKNKIVSNQWNILKKA